MQLSYNVIAQQCNIVYLIYHQQFRYCGTISQAYFSALQRDGSVTVVYQCFIKIIATMLQINRSNCWMMQHAHSKYSNLPQYKAPIIWLLLASLGTCNQVMRLPISYIACISHTLLIKLELTDRFTASGMTPLTSCASSPTCLLRGCWVAVPPPSPSTPSSSWYSYSCNWDTRWRWSEWST